jgi:hypothetical protein
MTGCCWEFYCVAEQLLAWVGFCILVYIGRSTKRVRCGVAARPSSTAFLGRTPRRPGVGIWRWAVQCRLEGEPVLESCYFVRP